MIARLLLTGIFVFGVTACANRAGGPERSDLLVIAAMREPTSLNPLYLQGSDAEDISTLGYSFLTTYNAQGRVITDAATIVPTVENGGISRDGKQIVFHLRRNIVWQDGYSLTARDVVFTYGAIMNPLNAVTSRSGYDRIARVWARDPYTIIVELPRPYAPIVTAFFGGESSYPILPDHLLVRYANLNHVAFNGAPIGSGPYRFTKWVRGERLELTANDRYYGAKPAIPRLILRFVHDPSTAVNELMTREVDATFDDPIPSSIPAIRSIPNHRVIVTLVPDFGAILFNMSDPVMKDVAIRRALASAIDRHMLVAKTTFGLYDPEGGMRGMFTWAFDPSVGTIAYDPGRARRLLAGDGWLPGDNGIRVKNGRRLEINLVSSKQFSIASQVIPIMIEEAHDVGINLVTRVYDRSELFALDGPLYRGNFQAALMGFGSAVDPDPSSWISCDQRTPNGSNFSHYCSEAVDRALRRAISVYDRAERRRIYSFIQRQLLADVPYDFLWQSPEVDVIPSALHGYQPSLVSPYNSVAHWRL
jgi:peptide/nickel transport system substrate-binding protein